MTCTDAFSYFSDWICSSLVVQGAREYSRIVYAPEHFVEMLFWVEDKRYPVHFGVDPVSIIRALIFNLRGGQLQGASTIAQQIYGIRVGRPRGISRSLGYKLRQTAWSIYSSAINSKAAILKEYVDTVYLGRSYHGLDRATAGYFNTTRTSLTAAQSFFLAERIAAPNRVSVQRIANLLNRVPIQMNLRRNRSTASDVVKVYQQVFGCGGEMWRSLAK
jgi:membrane peptidoglycan carboxypeptidase